MMTYTVEFHLVETGEVQIKAYSEEHAKELVRKMRWTELADKVKPGREVWVARIVERK